MGRRVHLRRTPKSFGGRFGVAGVLPGAVLRVQRQVERQELDHIMEDPLWADSWRRSRQGCVRCVACEGIERLVVAQAYGRRRLKHVLCVLVHNGSAWQCWSVRVWSGQSLPRWTHEHAQKSWHVWTEYPMAGNIRSRHGCRRPIIGIIGIQHRAGGGQSGTGG